MKHGVWVWPADAVGQRTTLQRISEVPHLVAALAAVAKSKEGLSNPEMDEVTADNSEWMTFWLVKQLTSLGFVAYKVDLFGGPARYEATDLGRNALSAITGQASPKAVAPAQRQTPAPQT